MIGRGGVVRWLAGVGLGCALLVVPERAIAQEDTAVVARATLRGWEERLRHTIFDRSGAYDGRLSDRGILQRFNPEMDGEYHLDVISFSFALTEVYEWYQRDAGARFAAGSINHLRLVQGAQAAGVVSLGSTWDVRAQLTQSNTLQADRALIEVQFRHTMASGKIRPFLNTTLKALKPESDIELGLDWFAGKARLTGAVAVLDPFNNLIYQGLGVGGVADTTLDYTSQPFTFRVGLEAPLGNAFRAELHALFMTPSYVVAHLEGVPDSGFAQGEEYAYAGGLLEWEPSRQTAVGARGTWVRARLDRDALPSGLPEDDFDLTEETWQAGLYFLHAFSSRFRTETWVSRVWRTEQRLRPDTTVAPAVDYEDRSWAGKVSVRYGQWKGFQGELGLDIIARDVIRSSGIPNAGRFDDTHARLRFDIGWRFGQRAYIMAGTNADLDQDNDTATGWFDGAHARFGLYW
jgi:hypothetical protein